MSARGRKTWELSRDDLARLPADALPLVRALIESEAREYAAAFANAGNGAHLWRAWRLVRLLPDVPADLREEIARYLDECAKVLVHDTRPTSVVRALKLSNQSGARGEGAAAVDAQLADAYLLARYQHLLALDKRHGREANKAAAYRRLATEFETSAGAIKQRVLKLEGRGQYSTRSRQKR